jgi:hypothetical protein
MTYRWMAEVHYNNGEPPEVVTFEELAELHDIVELGPDWNTMSIRLSSRSIGQVPLRGKN